MGEWWVWPTCEFAGKSDGTCLGPSNSATRWDEVAWVGMRLLLTRLCAAWCLCLPLATRAMNVRPPSFAELVGAADRIVIGRVVSVASELKEVRGEKVPFTF